MEEQKHPLAVLAEEKPTLEKIAAIVTDKPDEEVAALITSELGFLKHRYQLSEYLRQCTPQSLLNCVKQAIRDNLSLNESAGLVYMYPQNINAGTKENKNYVTVAKYEPSPDGRISIARQTGRILDITRPKLHKDGNGKIIGGEVELLKPSVPEPRWETYEFEEGDIERWKKASAKKNFKGIPNALYTCFNDGPDPEFIRAKIVKHALKKLGTNINEVKAVTPIKVEPMFTPEVNAAAAVDAQIMSSEGDDFTTDM